MKVLILGGVAAGTKAAAKIKRQDQSADVTILVKDRDISYAGCGLPYYVGGLIETRDELIVNTPQKYTALTGARVLTGREAVGLNAAAKTVTAKNLTSGAAIWSRTPRKRLWSSAAASLVWRLRKICWPRA